MDRYIGDGVYASYDDYHIWLDLRAQDRTTRIALEPNVVMELIQYAIDVGVIKPREDSDNDGAK